ncbi:Ig-like domain-containing protein [Peribacillus acanthi]|uniref:Ig-like domain-containing protein n=1 Tax=Peribacillus acanthi TaxID=2171554 RepID=UPI000D3EA89D|nr:Ig-like domain-containing protein [Peribacillus acanthi]
MRKRFGIFLIMVLVVLFGSPASIPFAEKTLEKKVISNPKKTWSITFNDPVDEKTAKSTTIYIVDSSNRKHPTKLSVEGKGRNILTVTPAQSYNYKKNYTLVIKKSLRSSDKEYLREHIYLPFEVQEKKSIANKEVRNSEKVVLKNGKEKTEKKKTKEKVKQLKVSVTTRSYVTQINVTAPETVTELKVNGYKLHYMGNNTFSLGLSDVDKGAELSFEAFTGKDLAFEELHQVP